MKYYIALLMALLITPALANDDGKTCTSICANPFVQKYGPAELKALCLQCKPGCDIVCTSQHGSMPHCALQCPKPNN